MEDRDLKRFWSFVRRTKSCWLWTGGVNKKGKWAYGLFRVGGGRVLAHRFSYELHGGKIEPGLLVCHKCDVPLCVNPRHLFKGDHQANMDDMIKKRGSYKNPGQKKTLQLNTRWSPEEVQDLERKAAARKMKISPYLAWLVKKDRAPVLR